MGLFDIDNIPNMGSYGFTPNAGVIGMKLPDATDKILAAQAALNEFIDKNIRCCAAINAWGDPTRDMADALDDTAALVPEFTRLLDTITAAMFVRDAEYRSLIEDAIGDAEVADFLRQEAETIREDLSERRAA